MLAMRKLVDSPVIWIIKSGIILCATFGVAINSASARFIFSLEDPGVQFTQVDGTLFEETFDNLPTGNGPFSFGPATYSNNFVISPADVYGGAEGTGQYISTFAATVTLDSPQNYFGFWWSAGNASNRIQLFSGDEVVGDFSTQSVLDFIDTLAPDVQTAYFGNPNDGGGNSREPYAFLNITGVDGATFDRLELSGHGFESDNHVFADNVSQLSGTTVPEPENFLGSIVVLGCLGFFKFMALKGQKREKATA